MAIRSWTDHREATINDAEHYTGSWTVLMSIPVDGQQISAYSAGKTTEIWNISGK